MIGVAYEVGAIFDKEVRLPDNSYDVIDEKAADYVTVRSESKEDCYYYGDFIIKDIEIGPAPQWMQNYIMAEGIRPFNNVVDITYFVLMESGLYLLTLVFYKFGSMVL